MGNELIIQLDPDLTRLLIKLAIMVMTATLIIPTQFIRNFFIVQLRPSESTRWVNSVNFHVDRLSKGQAQVSPYPYPRKCSPGLVLAKALGGRALPGTYPTLKGCGRARAGSKPKKERIFFFLYHYDCVCMKCIPIKQAGPFVKN